MGGGLLEGGHDHEDESLLGLNFRCPTPKSIPPQGSGFQKWRPPFKALLNEFTPSITLAWYEWGVFLMIEVHLYDTQLCRVTSPKPGS